MTFAAFDRSAKLSVALFLLGCGASSPPSISPPNDELLQLKFEITAAKSEEKALNDRLEAAGRKGDMLRQQIEETETAIRIQEQLLERDRLRAHLLQVVDETKRKAAAEEEYRVRFQGQKTTKARALVQGVIEARSLALMEVVDLFTDAGLIDADARASLREKEASVASAKAAFDLAAFQVGIEELNAAAHRLIDAARSADPKSDVHEISGRVAEILKARGTPYIEDEIGVWTGAEALENLISVLGEIKSSSLIVFSYSPKALTDEIALQQSTRQANNVKEEAIEKGVGRDLIRSRGCGRFSPTPLVPKSASTVFLVVSSPLRK